jgi:hypothetical protein
MELVGGRQEPAAAETAGALRRRPVLRGGGRPSEGHRCEGDRRQHGSAQKQKSSNTVWVLTLLATAGRLPTRFHST